MTSFKKLIVAMALALTAMATMAAETLPVIKVYKSPT